MIRQPKLLKLYLTRRIFHSNKSIRQLSNVSSVKSKSNKAVIISMGVATGFIGVCGYSAYSVENRKLVESTVPGSNYLFDLLLGPLDEAIPSVPVEHSLPEVSVKPVAVIETADELRTDAVVPVTEVKVKTEEGDSAEEVPRVFADREAPPTSPSIREMTELEARLAEREAKDIAENAALSEVLNDLISLAEKEVLSALSVCEDASKAIRTHAEQAYDAVNRGLISDEASAYLNNLSRQKQDLMRSAEEKIDKVHEVLENLSNQIASGYASLVTKGNQSLILAEDALSELKYRFEKAKSVIPEAVKNCKIVEDYKQLVELGRLQLESEVKSLLPDVKLGEKSETLTTDELNLLIAHAHRKILHLQKQLARQQILDQEKFNEILSKRREEDAEILQARVNADVEKQKKELQAEYREKLTQLQEEQENELRSQLKRQAAAHSDHLADVLAVQEKELSTKWTNRLDAELQAERDNYHLTIAEMQGKLQGIMTAVAARTNEDKAAYAARELWLACESLRSSLRHGSEQAKSWEEQLQPLEERIKAISSVAGSSNPYIKAILEALSEEASTRGVYTEEALRERFIKVDRICKQVSLVGENGGSLFRYFLSYLQSFLLIESFDYLPGSEVRDEEIEVDSLSTHDILARAKYFLNKDDLLQTLRYMNLLKGEPRNVASDWIREARLTLEARLAADALLAHAAAVAVRTL